MKNETPIQGHYDTSSVFVAVIGRPNVGKSSLTNLLVGREGWLIVTSKPQHHPYRHYSASSPGASCAVRSAGHSRRA